MGGFAREPARIALFAIRRVAVHVASQVAFPARRVNAHAVAAWPGAERRNETYPLRAAMPHAAAAWRGAARTLSRSDLDSPGDPDGAAIEVRAFRDICRDAWNALPAMARIVNHAQRIAARWGSSQCIAEAPTAATPRTSVAPAAARRAFRGMGLPESSNAHHAQEFRRWKTRLGTRAMAYVHRTPLIAAPIMWTSAGVIGEVRATVSGVGRTRFDGRS